MDQISVKKYWYAYLYDQLVKETDDVEFIIKSIGLTPKRVLEVACGSGRILCPLINAGHSVVGIDVDEFMIERCKAKISNSSRAQLRIGNGVNDDWGNNFDTVILAANILLNIETQIDYAEAQKVFLRKAYESLQVDGQLILIFDNSNIWPTFSNQSVKVIFEGADDNGVYGRYLHQSNTFDEISRIMETKQRVELTTVNGEAVNFENVAKKYFLKSNEVVDWLEQIGFRNLELFGDYNSGEFTRESYKVVVIARR